ncbi:MAG: hypothetical protein PHO92_01470 [Candidatus Peribacteraceae bacterium]|nr:hypothetical protein [Candidatus Peribacteraceae bacterium]
MTDIELASFVQKSQLLTEAEKSYWATSLPKMTPQQKERLIAILNRAAKIQWNEQIQNYLSLIGKATQSYFRKGQPA